MERPNLVMVAREATVSGAAQVVGPMAVTSVRCAALAGSDGQAEGSGTLWWGQQGSHQTSLCFCLCGGQVWFSSLPSGAEAFRYLFHRFPFLHKSTRISFQCLHL